MKMRWRLVLFVAGALGLLAVYGAAVLKLSPVGQFVSPYGLYVNDHVVSERHVTDAVTAVNFDYRGIDTLGEEFILFASVMGAVVLLREENEKKTKETKEASKSRQVPEPSDSILGWSLAMTGMTMLYGLYTITHGQLTPGGGFQGGVICATVPLIIYLSKDFKNFQMLVSYRWVEVAEGLGVLGFIFVGLIGLFDGGPYLQNVLGLGTTGSVFSGGTIPLISLTTGLEVAAGFVLLLTAFLQYAVAEEPREEG